MRSIRTCFVLAALALLVMGCGSVGVGAAYDPEAKEAMVRIVDKRVAATDVRQSGGGSSTFVPITAGGRMLLIPVLISGSGPKLTVYEYVVAFPNGKTLSVYSDYPHYDKGMCVKVFESDRPTYPRLAPGWDCASK
jgi:hypothetical protein